MNKNYNQQRKVDKRIEQLSSEIIKSDTIQQIVDLQSKTDEMDGRLITLETPKEIP